jgi:hypothetical protein
MGKLTINGPFSIAMLVYQRVTPSCRLKSWSLPSHQRRVETGEVRRFGRMQLLDGEAPPGEGEIPTVSMGKNMGTLW